MNQPIPFEIMAMITIIWTMICAFIIAPMMVWKKIKKHGATPENIKKDVTEDIKTEIDSMEGRFETKIQDFETRVGDSVRGIEAKVDEIKIPEIPDLDLKKLYEDLKDLMAEDINILQENLPTIVVNSLKSEEGQMVLLEAAKASAPSISGAIYREMGIDKERAENGIKMTRDWFVNSFEKVTDPRNKKVAAIKHILTQIFPDEGTDWVDEKIAAIREIQILLQPSNGSNGQQSSGIPFQPQAQKNIPISLGMQG